MVQTPITFIQISENSDQKSTPRVMQRDGDYSRVKQIIEKKFATNVNPALIPKIKVGYFTARITDEGIFVDNLNSQPFLPWEVFSEAVGLMLKNSGSADKGDAMNYRLGDEKLDLNSIEGHIAKVVYGKQAGSSVFRRITPVACILIWAGICKNAPGKLMLTQEFPDLW